jgi:hypothetical protein
MRIRDVLLVSLVYFGVAMFGIAVVLRPCFDWLILHLHCSLHQIYGEGVRVREIIRPNTVVFTNGARGPIGVWPNLIYGVLLFGWWILDVWITKRFARRFAPTVWAELPENRANPNRQINPGESECLPGGG